MKHNALLAWAAAIPAKIFGSLCLGYLSLAASSYGQVEEGAALFSPESASRDQRPTETVFTSASDYDVTRERGPHHRVHYTVGERLDAEGQTVWVTNRYIQLTSGLHYWEDRQWKESQAVIETHPQGAVARQGPYQVIFAQKLGQPGSIDLLAPDGTRLRSHLLGLCYLDTVTGQRTWLGLVKESEGQVLPPNQVLYGDVLDGIRANLRYTYNLSGFEQDLILLERPMDPEKLGLNSASVRLEVVTEFTEAPLPTISGQKLRGTPEESQARAADFASFRDEPISLEQVHFGVSRFFPQTNGSSESRSIPTEYTGQRAGKRWLQEGGRRFLLEQIPYSEIRSELRGLPLSPRASLPPSGSPRSQAIILTASSLGIPQLPASRLPAPPAPMEWAHRPTAPSPALVLDYTTLISPITNFTFQGNETYYVNGTVILYGYAYVEGSTIVKYNTTNGTWLYLQNPLIRRFGLANPAVFTIKDDDSVGQMIAGSTHTPVMANNNSYAAIYTCYDQTGPSTFNNFKFKYLRHPIYFNSLRTPQAATNWVRHCQFYQCGYPIAAAPNSVIRLQNALCEDLIGLIFPHTNTMISCILEQVTVHHAQELNIYPGVALYLTNCLFYNVTNPVPAGPCSSNHVLFTTSNVFSPVLGGNSYLLNDSYRNTGTTNIHPRLLAELRARTTCPPSYLSSLSQDTVLGPNPAVGRDTDAPDLGYHYEPIDYLVSGLTVNHALTLTNGVSLGVYGPTGLVLGNGGRLLGGAMPQQHNFLVHYKVFQEGSIPGETNTISLVALNSSVGTEINLRFTDLSVLNTSGGARFLTSSANAPVLVFRDGRFSSGTNDFLGSLAFTNCLFEAVGLNWNAQSLSLANNTLCGGVFHYQVATGNSCSIKNTLFDKALIVPGSVNGSYTFRSNAYVTTLYGTLSPPEPIAPAILYTSPAYETGPFGDHYIPLNGYMSALFWGGDGSPAANGLTHYTTSANGWIRVGGTVADIGLNYVKAQTDGRIYFSQGVDPNSPSASSQYHPAYAPAFAADEWLNTLWHSALQGTNEWFRINLLSPQTVSIVAYHPRWGCLNGTYLQYAIYVTSSASTNRTDWGPPVLEGGWDWPVDAERKEITFPPATGQYVIFLCKEGVNDWACGAEFGVYLHGTTTHIAGWPIDSDEDGAPDYIEDANGNGVIDSGESDPSLCELWFCEASNPPANCAFGNGTRSDQPLAISNTPGAPNSFDQTVGPWLKGLHYYPNQAVSLVPSNLPVRLNFYGGTYLTDGVPGPAAPNGNDSSLTYPYLTLCRQDVTYGNNRVVFKLRDNAPNPQGYKYLLQSSTYLADFQMANIELDCNWSGQSAYNSAGYLGGYKNGALNLQSVQVKLEGLKVYNFGANGPVPPGASVWETYPLLVKTASLGQADSPSPLTIASCTVSNFTGLNNGRAIGILVETRDHTVPSSTNLTGSTQYPAGFRTSPSALIISNSVFNTRTNELLTGYGLFNSEQVTFEQNLAEGVQVGFRCETLYPNAAPGYPEVMTNLVFRGNIVRNTGN